MLLNILNLPFNVKYSEIKDLVRMKCGIDEIILDNLVPHDNRTKKITVGLVGEDDAAIFMRKMNGVNMNGFRLQVVPKSKISSFSNANQPPQDMGPSYQNAGQQGSWPQGQFFSGLPPLMGNVPTMVPPVNFGAPNTYGMYNPNQNSYSMMNQAGFDINLSPPNMGNQPYSYQGNQDHSHGSWENNDWDQQQHSDGFQNDQQQKRQIHVWDVNPGPSWEANSRIESNQRINDRDSSRRDNNLSSNNDRYRPNQSTGPLRERDSQYRRHKRSPPPPRDRFGGDRDANFERRPRDDRRDDSYFQQRNNSRRPRSRSFERREQYAPPSKRPRQIQTVQRSFAGPVSGGNLSAEELQLRVIENAKSVRGQLAATKARAMLSDKRFKHKVRDPVQLLRELKVLLNERLDECLKNDYTVPYKEMEMVYNATYSFKSHFGLFKEALAKVGGKLFSKADIGEGKQNPTKPQGDPVFGNLKVDHTNEPKATSSATPKVPSKPPQTTPTVRPLTRAAKKKVLRATQKAQPIPPHLQVTQIPPTNLGSIPLAQIPGRIPHYREGDKKLHSKQKREMAEELTNLLTDPYYSRSMNSLKPELQRAIGEELDLLASVVESVCHPPVPDILNAEKFCDFLRDLVPKEVVKVMKANVVRRIVPMRPILVRVFAVPPIKRLPLEMFLKDYNVSALKKSKFQPYYVATCETVADHDKLCMMKPLIENSIVTFKPFHLVEDKKIAKGAALKERNALLREQMQIPNSNVFEVDDFSTAFYEDFGAKDTKKGKADNKSDELYQEMKDLFDQINDADQDVILVENKNGEIKNEQNKNCENENGEIKNDENKNDENKNDENKNDENTNGAKENDNNEQPIKEDIYESPLKSCEEEMEEVKTEETNEVIDDLNEVKNNDQLLVVEDRVGESEKETALVIADDIGWPDVNDDDLEDW